VIIPDRRRCVPHPRHSTREDGRPGGRELRGTARRRVVGRARAKGRIGRAAATGESYFDETGRPRDAHAL
jgi:hypothetical protein